MFELEHSGPKLLYQQIIEWMRQQISSGDWPEHYRLPSEFDLSAQLNVSRGTVRKAIKHLISEGLLLSIHGRGTFVASKIIEQPLAERLIGFSEALIEKNIPFTTQVISQRLISPPPKMASILSLSPKSQVLKLERVRQVRKSPLIYLINYVRTDRCPGIQNINFEKYRLFEALENKYQLALGWGQRTFEAQVADENVAKFLEISPNDPVMFMEQVLYLQDGSPIELSNIWIRGNNFRLSAIVKRSEKHELNENSLEFVIKS